MEQDGNGRPPTSTKNQQGFPVPGRSQTRSDRPWHRTARRQPDPALVPSGQNPVKGGQSPGQRPVASPVWTGPSGPRPGWTGFLTDHPGAQPEFALVTSGHDPVSSEPRPVKTGSQLRLKPAVPVTGPVGPDCAPASPVPNPVDRAPRRI